MKTFEQFQVELQEIAAVRNLSRVMRAGPTFKAAIPKGVPTKNLYHGTSSNFANKIRTKDAKNYENAEFLRNTGIPIDLTKKKKTKKNIKTA